MFVCVCFACANWRCNGLMKGRRCSINVCCVCETFQNKVADCDIIILCLVWNFVFHTSHLLSTRPSSLSEQTQTYTSCYLHCLLMNWSKCFNNKKLPLVMEKPQIDHLELVELQLFFQSVSAMFEVHESTS